MKTTPTSGKTLYLPVRAIVRPEPIAPVMMPSTSGQQLQAGDRRARAVDHLEVLRQEQDAAEHAGAEHDAGRRR